MFSSFFELVAFLLDIAGGAKLSFGSVVTFDQNVKNATSAEFGILAVSLPDWWFSRTKSVIGTFGQTVRAGIF